MCLERLTYSKRKTKCRTSAVILIAFRYSCCGHCEKACFEVGITEFSSKKHALPAENANSGTKIAIFLQTCVKTKMDDDTSAVKSIVLQETGCGPSGSDRFSGRIGGVNLRTPPALQWQAI